MKSTRTFSTRSNAKRHALTTGVPVDQIEIVPQGKGDEVRFGWRKVGARPATTVVKPTVTAPTAQRETRNGVKRPLPGTKCVAVWAWMDKNPNATPADARAWAEAHGQNANNATIERCQWLRFHRKDGKKAA